MLLTDCILNYNSYDAMEAIQLMKDRNNPLRLLETVPAGLSQLRVTSLTKKIMTMKQMIGCTRWKSCRTPRTTEIQERFLVIITMSCSKHLIVPMKRNVWNKNSKH
jgi:hypothetical protein